MACVLDEPTCRRVTAGDAGAAGSAHAGCELVRVVWTLPAADCDAVDMPELSVDACGNMISLSRPANFACVSFAYNLTGLLAPVGSVTLTRPCAGTCTRTLPTMTWCQFLLFGGILAWDECESDSQCAGHSRDGRRTPNTHVLGGYPPWNLLRTRLYMCAWEWRAHIRRPRGYICATLLRQWLETSCAEGGGAKTQKTLPNNRTTRQSITQSILGFFRLRLSAFRCCSRL